MSNRKLYNLIKESSEQDLVSEGLMYHLENSLDADQNIYRPGSDEFFGLFREVRELWNAGLYQLSENEEFYIAETEIGEFGIYEGVIVPLDFPMIIENLEEAKYKGRKVKLGKKGAARTKGGKARVYVRNDKGKVVKVEFGSSMPDAMGDSDDHKARRKSYGNRHNCADKKDRTKPGYWSCRLTKLFGRSIPGWW